MSIPAHTAQEHILETAQRWHAEYMMALLHTATCATCGSAAGPASLRYEAAEGAILSSSTSRARETKQGLTGSV